MPLSTNYNPKDKESKIYQLWQEQGLGSPEIQAKKQDLNLDSNSYTILMPPPNLTGDLHAGHAFGHYLMDTLTRLHRQKGKQSLWCPGVDHAGIQMEGVITKILQRQGKKKQDLSDQEFLDFTYSKAMEWRDNISQQSSILGDSPDYKRNLFTLDDSAKDMVNLAFEKYWQDDLIYKGAYLVNWSTGLQTALSDVTGEIEYQKKIDPFVNFLYQAKHYQILDQGLQIDSEVDSKNNLQTGSPIDPKIDPKTNPKTGRHTNLKTNELTNSQTWDKLKQFAKDYLKPCQDWPKLEVGTVRIETKSADVAVAMHPSKFDQYFNLSIFKTEDKGFDLELAELFLQKIKNYQVQIWYHLPSLAGQDLKLVFSQKVDPKFGTGILKITPGHDIFDYQLYQEFVATKILSLQKIQTAVDRQGKLTQITGEFAGMSVQKARPLIIQKLISTGYIPKKSSSSESIDEGKTTNKATDFNPEQFAQMPVQDQYVYLAQAYPEYKIDWKYEHNVAICERSKTVIEPLISEEFFVDYHKPTSRKNKTLQQLGLEGVQQTNFFSSDFKDRGLEFLQNIRDWCISRDLTWGHPIPVWYNVHPNYNPQKKFFSYQDFCQNKVVKTYNSKPIKVRELFQVCSKKPSLPGQWVAEKKILDTWFSSTLWPLMTLKFVEYTKQAKKLVIIHGGHSYDNHQQFLAELAQKPLKLNLPSYNLKSQDWKQDFLDSLADKANLEIVYPQMPNKQNADYQAWKIEFEKILPDLDKDSILIGHSLGGIFLAKYLSENKLAQKLDSLHLVAAPYYKCGNFNLDLKDDPNKFNQNLNQNVAQTFIWQSPEDTVVDFKEAQAYKNLIPKAQLKILQGRGHFKTRLFAELEAEILKSVGQKLAQEDFLRYYPTQDMATGKEIFYLWIVRMIVFGKYFTGKIPFKNLIITPTVLDDKGKKMSKSLGNGLNPVGAIHNFSSDSLRLTLLGSMIPNRNIKMGGQIADRLLEKYRNFGNKLWNIAKFLEYQLQKHQAELEPKNPKTLSKASVWILKKFSSLDKSLDKNIQTYEFAHSINSIYHFVWNNFADWYVEYLKTDPSQLVFAKSLYKQLIITLSPYLPFECEVIWQEFFKQTRLLAFELKNQNWSQQALKEFGKRSSQGFDGFDKKFDLVETADSLDFEEVISLIQKIRSLRGLFALDPSQKITVFSSSQSLSPYTKFCELVGRLKIQNQEIENQKIQNKLESSFYQVSTPNIFASINILDYIQDKESQIVRTEKDIKSLQAQVFKLQKQLANPNFLAKADQKIVTQKQADLESRQLELAKQNQKLKILSGSLSKDLSESLSENLSENLSKDLSS